LLIDNKIKAPSQIASIESLVPVFRKIKITVDNLRNKIKKNNETSKNIVSEKLILKNEIWKFIVDEINDDLKTYDRAIEGIGKGKQKIEILIKQESDQINELSKQIRLKEAEVTSVVHTANEINNILALFGFTNFRLMESTEKGFYQIVREDGSIAKETLSEGEYRFITFLYFYRLLKGSTEGSGITRDKVVVFDDPISSLDSDVLFVYNSPHP
jgi:wobble nucleotide-excising tRNase